MESDMLVRCPSSQFKAAIVSDAVDHPLSLSGLKAIARSFKYKSILLKRPKSHIATCTIRAPSELRPSISVRKNKRNCVNLLREWHFIVSIPSCRIARTSGQSITHTAGQSKQVTDTLSLLSTKQAKTQLTRWRHFNSTTYIFKLIIPEQQIYKLWTRMRYCF